MPTNFRRLVGPACVFFALVTVSCGSTRSDPTRSGPPIGEVATHGSCHVDHRDSSRLPSAFRTVMPKLHSGAEPTTDAHFTALARRGVRTIISVDGATPDARAARRHGIRTVHIPVGYDGIDRTTARLIARVSSETSPPFYVHCHHGVHRGPVAAALLALIKGHDRQSALDFLELAGTSRDYPGLWKAIEDFDRDAVQATELDARSPLPERAEVSSLRIAMASIDRALDRLELCRESGWTPPIDHPDLTPARESTILREGFRESIRAIETTEETALLRGMERALGLATALESHLERDETTAAAGALHRLRNECQSCHKSYRDSR